jgi:hypothetical protein
MRVCPINQAVRITLAGRVAELEEMRATLSSEVERAHAAAPPSVPAPPPPLPPAFEDDKRAIAAGALRRDRAGSAPLLSDAAVTPPLPDATAAAALTGLPDILEINSALAAAAATISSAAAPPVTHYSRPTKSFEAKVAIDPSAAVFSDDSFASVTAGLDSTGRFLDPTNTSDHENRVDRRRASVIQRNARSVPLAPAQPSGGSASSGGGGGGGSAGGRRQSMGAGLGAASRAGGGVAFGGSAPPPLPPRAGGGGVVVVVVVRAAPRRDPRSAADRRRRVRGRLSGSRARVRTFLSRVARASRCGGGAF